MSRRRNRRTSKAKFKSEKQRSKAKSSRKGSLGKVLLWGGVLSGVLIASVIGGYAYARSHIASKEFADKLGGTISGKLGGESAVGELDKLRWNGWEAKSNSYTFSKGKGVFKAMSAEQIRASLRIGSFNEDAWDVHDLEMQALKVELGSREKDYQAYKAPEPTGIAAFFPSKAKLGDISIDALEGHYQISDGPIAFKNVRVKGKALSREMYQADCFDGEITFPWSKLGKVAHLDSKLHYEPGMFRIDDMRLRAFSDNRLEVDALFDLKKRINTVTGKVHDVDVSHFVPSDWLRRFTGFATADFKITQDRNKKNGTGDVTTGHLIVEKGVLSSLDLLQKISTYTRNSAYARIEFDQFECDFRYERGATILSNIQLHSRGKGKLTGRVRIGADDSVDGLIHVGIPKGTLSFIPGAETHVFKPGKDNLHWATVKLGGTRKDITEDLTSQLIKGAVQGGIDMIPDLVTGGLSTDSGKSPSGNIVDAGMGLLDGVFGGVIGNAADQEVNAYGVQLDLSKQWKVDRAWKDGDKKAIAVLKSGGVEVAKTFLHTQQGMAKKVLEQWTKKRGNELKFAEARSFLTDRDAVAYITVGKSENNTKEKQCEVMAVVQISDETTLLIRMNGPLKEDKLLVELTEKAASSVRKPSKKLLDSDLLPVPIPDIPSIPLNPFG